MQPAYIDDFENARIIIEQAKHDAVYKVNETIINLYWSIGEYVSKKQSVTAGGVQRLSSYLIIYCQKNRAFADIQRRLFGE